MKKITIIIMLFIISIIGVTKLSLRHSIENSKLPEAKESVLNENSGLNIEEKNVLCKLSGFIDMNEKETQIAGSNYSIYYNNLRDYLSKPGINLVNEKKVKIVGLISDLNELRKLENTNEIEGMSYDGREVAIYLLTEIYKISGLKLSVNVMGDIDQITDYAGEIIYEGKIPEQESLRIDALLITVTSLFAVLILCYFIAKKNQLFKKDGAYDGLNEKGIA